MSATLYGHEDGRYAVAPGTESPAFTRGDPKWHRVGPVDVSALHAGAAAAESSDWLATDKSPLHLQLCMKPDACSECDRIAALTSAPAVPEAIKDAGELELFEMTVEQFEDSNETSTDYATLMRWARMGLLECTHFTVMPKGQALIDAKGVQPGERGEG